MPTYEYKCERCQKNFEIVKPMSEYDKQEKCPVCYCDGKRIIGGGASFILKGEGFYQNDYKNNDGK